MKKESKHCEVCGASFLAYRKWAKYCSTAHALKAQRKRKRVELERLRKAVEGAR